MSEQIWREFRGVVRHAGGHDARLRTAGGQKQCGVSRDDTPICRVQERLWDKRLRDRAMELVVPDIGDRWVFWVATVGCALAAAALLMGPGFWTVLESWWTRRPIGRDWGPDLFGKDRFLTYAHISFGAVLVASSYGASVLARSKASVYRYKTFMPVPDAFGGQLKWDYYLTTALPQADIETLAAAGAGKRGALASRAVARFQGALSIPQARIKCKDAIAFLRSALRGGGGGTDSAPDTVRETDRMVAAFAYVDDATERLRGVQALAQSNAVDAARLRDIVDGKAPSATAKLVDIAQRVLASRAEPYLARGERGSLPADPAYLDQVEVTLEVALPRVAEAGRAMRSALENMRSLGERLQPAAVSMNVLDDARYSAAISEALTAIPKSGPGAASMAAVKAMTDDDVLKADAALGDASASMDYTVMPIARGGDVRIRAVTNQYYWTIVAVAGLWALVACVEFGKWLFGVEDGVTRLRAIIERSRAKGDLAASVVDALMLATRAVVFVIVVTALGFQALALSVKYDVQERARINMLERLADALRRMVELGGVRAAVSQPDEFAHALANLDLAMTYDVLTDRNAYARMPVRISALVIGVVIMAVTGVALATLVYSMDPASDVLRMKQLHAEARGGSAAGDAKALTGGAGLSDPSDPSDWGAQRDAAVLHAGVPSAVKAPVVLAGLVALVYYLVLMIMTEHRTRDLYVAQQRLQR